VLSIATLLRWWKIWSADDKFLKSYSCSHKNVQSDCIYMTVGIVGISHAQARQCTSVFQPFCCSGTPHKREGHSRNPVNWFVSPVTYARMKLQRCLWTYFPSRKLRAQPSWKRQSRQRWGIWNLTALVGSSMLLYLIKHNGRGGRRRPLSPATNIENWSLERPQ